MLHEIKIMTDAGLVNACGCRKMQDDGTYTQALRNGDSIMDEAGTLRTMACPVAAISYSMDEYASSLNIQFKNSVTGRVIRDVIIPEIDTLIDDNVYEGHAKTVQFLTEKTSKPGALAHIEIYQNGNLLYLNHAVDAGPPLDAEPFRSLYVHTYTPTPGFTMSINFYSYMPSGGGASQEFNANNQTGMPLFVFVGPPNDAVYTQEIPSGGQLNLIDIAAQYPSLDINIFAYQAGHFKTTLTPGGRSDTIISDTGNEVLLNLTPSVLSQFRSQGFTGITFQFNV